MSEPKENKKQVPLRISAELWHDLSAWAEDDFRSLNAQIEWLLSECVKKRRGRGRAGPTEMGVQ